MHTTQQNNPLHGLTLQAIIEQLVAKLGWPKMAEAVPIKCFSQDPSLKSSLKFLRSTPWAREQVEKLYLSEIAKQPQAKTTTQRHVEADKPVADKLSVRPASASKEQGADFVWPDLGKKS
ncbi:MAG: DUF2132 domain-containing protein [Paraglaciecola sp.]|nr:DUF2132 domain-containing protein [Paraglaciecola sp.]NCT47725.1 DUF2132 domain-containing protein [Paraglaciecola sp.]